VSALFCRDGPIFRERGLAWQSYAVEALSQSPWMKERDLSGASRSARDGSPLSGFIDQWVDSISDVGAGRRAPKGERMR
jgi:hypothetical protein